VKKNTMLLWKALSTSAAAMPSDGQAADDQGDAFLTGFMSLTPVVIEFVGNPFAARAGVREPRDQTLPTAPAIGSAIISTADAELPQT
jgi:hypothetical protein